MFKRLFRRPRPGSPATPTVNGAPPRLPRGVRVYAVGDVHGRLDLLRQLEQQILADADEAATGRRLERIVVYMGDYVDRGFESRQVIEHLLREPLPGFASVHLLGNHEVWMRDFLRGGARDGGADVAGSWLRFGGDATLVSYGVKLDMRLPEPERHKDAQAGLRASLPDEHLAFLQRLELAFGLGDYFFCHAGVRPEVPLDRQAESDLIWIREPFLSWGGDAGKVVVHGHTVEEHPTVRGHRIGIDTGACWTNNLTCVVLEGESWRFLSTLPANASSARAAS
jgi:serine/threonine protein phosphatase 1